MFIQMKLNSAGFLGSSPVVQKGSTDSRTETLKNSFFTRVYRAWNELPLNIRESNNLPVLRKKLLNYFYDKFSANFFYRNYLISILSIIYIFFFCN